MSFRKFKRRPKSGYYWRMMVFAMMCLILGIITFFYNLVVYCTIFGLFTFLFWYYGVMSSYDEKYKY